MPDLCQPNYLPCPERCSAFLSESACNAWSTRRGNLSACGWDQKSAKCIGNERTASNPTAILAIPTADPTLLPTPSVLGQSPESTTEDPVDTPIPDATRTSDSVAGSEPVSIATVLYASGSLALLVVFGLRAMIAQWRYKSRQRRLDDLFAFEHDKPGCTGAGQSNLSSPATLEAVPLTGNSVIASFSSTPRPASPPTTVRSSIFRAATPPSTSRLTTVSWSRSRSTSGSRYGNVAAGSGTRSLDRSVGMTYFPVSKRQDWLHDRSMRSTHHDRASLDRGRSLDIARHDHDSASLARTAIVSPRDTSTTLQRPSTSMTTVSRVQSPAIISEPILHSSPPRIPSLEFPSTLSRPSAATSSLVSTPTTAAPIPRPSPEWPVTSMKPMLPTSDQLSTPVPSPRRGILASGRAQPAAASPNRLLINSMVVSERGIVLDNVTPEKARMTLISFLDSDVGLPAGAPAPSLYTPGVSRPPAFGLRQVPATAPDTSTLSSVYALNNASTTRLTERTEYSPFLTQSDLVYRELMLMNGGSRPQSSVMPSPSVVSTLFATPGASSTVAMVGSPKNKDMLAGQAPVTPVSPYSMYDIGYYVEPGFAAGSSPEARANNQQSASNSRWR
ncbi:hypothetical protein BCR44DRAFT_341523 [Catenaria anguillulae PL171]|uniref:Uncharacterized protein n=1 Tax=Catenaria anguillulae PL171 TaxID=765915 RepID=A0A1Y2I468_9FUNG|nr:hypothetical protein BCR44DRAFT_341523 [Catenaria anguillulae PL171]